MSAAFFVYQDTGIIILKSKQFKMQRVNGKCQMEDTYCWPRLIEQLKMQNANGKGQMEYISCSPLLIK